MKRKMLYGIIFFISIVANIIVLTRGIVKYDISHLGTWLGSLLSGMAAFGAMICLYLDDRDNPNKKV